MADNWAAIQMVAARTLATKIPGTTEPARYAQDRAMRVVRSIEKLAPVVGQRIERPDLARIAALYAGIAQSVAGPGKAPDDDAYADAAELAADQLKDHVPAPDLDQILLILKEHRRRETELPEARLLADAVALEEFGLIGFWNQCRQFHAAGKSVEQLVKLWKAQHDYGYWENRLRDGFHYEASRRAAKERVARMRGVYESLQREHQGEDVGGNVLGNY